MKKAGLKSYSFSILVISLLALFGLMSITNATISSSGLTPTGGQWIRSFPMNYTVTPGGNNSNDSGYNLSLYNDVSGTWTLNYTKNNIPPDTLTNFTETGTLRDNSTGYTWGVEIKHNITGEASFTANQSFKVDTTAPSIPRIDLPANGSFSGNTHIFINWTNTTEANFKQYTIQFSNSSDFDDADIIKEQLILTRTITAVNFSENLDGNRLYYLRILAEDDAGNTAFEFKNVTIITSIPTITTINFSNYTFQKDTTPNFVINATHQFILNCSLWMTNTSNSSDLDTGFAVNQTSWTSKYVSNATNGTLTLTPNTLTNGIYKYGFVCYNRGGNSSGFTENRTIIIDSVTPSDFGCFYPINGTKSIDHTPSFAWNVSTDINFGNYTVWVDNNSDFSSPEKIVNYSGQSNTSVTINLREFNQSDRNWYWKVNTTDKAGNTAESVNCTSFYYRTDITNHYLPSGWSIISIMSSGTVNASDLGKGLGVSFSTITRYNQTKQFNNYNNGSATNEDMSFKKGDVVFINVNAITYWENQTWDTDTTYNAEGLINLTNATNAWNLFGIQNQSGRTLGNIEQLWIKALSIAEGATPYSGVINLTSTNLNNLSLQSIVFYNNTAPTNKRFVVHPFNYTLANTTKLDYGEVAWININNTWNLSTAFGTFGYVTLNRSALIGGSS